MLNHFYIFIIMNTLVGNNVLCTVCTAVETDLFFISLLMPMTSHRNLIMVVLLEPHNGFPSTLLATFFARFY